MTRYLTASFTACAALLLTAQAPGPTPPATSSRDCPHPDTATRGFVSAPAFTIRAPAGTLALVAVRNDQTRARGLMCVDRLPSSRGMLFVFPSPERMQGFWMKNTLVSLDMVFVTQHGVVSTVAANVPATVAGTPDDRVARRNGLGKYVIELGAGEAARHRIVRGSRLELPTLDAQ